MSEAISSRLIFDDGTCYFLLLGAIPTGRWGSSWASIGWDGIAFGICFARLLQKDLEAPASSKVFIPVHSIR